jgi:hypothetical protein
MANILFKAPKKKAASCDDYRHLDKEGDGLAYDVFKPSDDVIALDVEHLKGRIIIDCSMNGQFRLSFALQDNAKPIWD